MTEPFDVRLDEAVEALPFRLSYGDAAEQYERAKRQLRELVDEAHAEARKRRNLYRNTPFMISHGIFGRCRHGHPHGLPCWRCGLRHPIRYIRHVWSART